MPEVMPEYSEFAGEYIDVLRGCKELVDIDVAPERPGPVRIYETPAEARSDIEDVAASLPASEPDREVLEQKIGADIMLLRALGGEAIEFHEYVQGTIGITPEPIDEEYIQGGLAMLDMLLRDCKLGYNASFKDEFEQKFVIKNPETIRKDFAKSLRKTRKAARHLVADPGDIMDVELVEKPKEHWTAHLGEMAGKYKLAANLVKPLTKDWIATVTAHEYGGHVLQLELWRQAIETGDVNAPLGVTGAHTAYIIQAEGVAQTAEHLLLDDSPGSILSALHNECAGRVFHNVDYKINTGEDPQAVARYAKDRLPLLQPETLSADALVRRTQHPLYRAYLMAYAPSIELLRPIRSMERRQQQEVLKTLYERALTPAQIGRLVTEGQKVAA